MEDWLHHWWSSEALGSTWKVAALLPSLLPTQIEPDFKVSSTVKADGSNSWKFESIVCINNAVHGTVFLHVENCGLRSWRSGSQPPRLQRILQRCGLSPPGGVSNMTILAVESMIENICTLLKLQTLQTTWFEVTSHLMSHSTNVFFP